MNTDEFDDFFEGLEKSKPRAHHYQFVHRALPQAAFADPANEVGGLLSSDAHKVVQNLWDQVCSRCAEPTDLSAASIKVHAGSAGVFPCAIIEMPVPLHNTEAYFAALVLRRVSFQGALSILSPALLYYTLEKGQKDDGSGTTLFCGWTQDERHVNFGEGPAPTLSQFIQLVSSKAAETVPSPPPIPASVPPTDIPPQKWWQVWK